MALVNPKRLSYDANTFKSPEKATVSVQARCRNRGNVINNCLEDSGSILGCNTDRRTSGPLYATPAVEGMSWGVHR